MPRQQDSARIVLFLVFCFWLFSGSGGGGSGGSLLNSPWLPSSASTRLVRQRKAHGLLNSTKWGDFGPRASDDPPELQSSYLDLVGFRAVDGYAWDDLKAFRTRCLELNRHANPAGAAAVPVWQNATGIVGGEWVRRDGSVPRTVAAYNLTKMAPGVTWEGGHAGWSRNVTGRNGRVLLRIEEEEDHLEYGEEAGLDGPRSGGLVRTVSVLATVQDEERGGNSWEMRLHGVHWPHTGVMLVTTTGEKFAGIFGLPHLTPGPDFFRSSQALLNRSLDAVLRRKERNRYLGPGNPWATSSEGPSDDYVLSPHCEYVIYLQLHPVKADQLKLSYFEPENPERLSAYVADMETELRHPTGAPVKAMPKLSLSFVAWSPDCSFSLEGEHLVGMKDEILNRKGRYWLLTFAAVLFAQMQLLKGQMKESSTPSTLGRVSFYTAGTMLFADGLVFAGSTTLSLSTTSLFLPSLVLSVAAFVSILIGSVFVSDVHKIQEPERRHRERAREQPTAQTNTSASTSATPPIIVPSDQDVDAEIVENTTATATATATAIATSGAAALPLPVTNANTANTPARVTLLTSISGRFLLLGTIIFFLSIAATSWPTRVRAAYANTLAAVYLSMWVPQIWRNVQRNSRRAFAWRFMLGQSALRLLPVAYVYLRRAEDNVLFTRPDSRAFAVLAAWVWVQLWALAFQDVLGPRFGIPDSWTPHAWDYHPILREDNVEAGGLPIGLVLGGSAPSSPVSTVHRPTQTSSLDAQKDGDADDDPRTRRREREKEAERGDPSTCVRSMDCAICREVLEVPVVRAGAEDPATRGGGGGGGGGVAGLLQRRSYMVTPCRHIFHASCLEGWLRYRLQCPICRDELPPL